MRLAVFAIVLVILFAFSAGAMPNSLQASEAQSTSTLSPNIYGANEPSVAIDPNNSSIILLASNSFWIDVSHNNGLTWNTTFVNKIAGRAGTYGWSDPTAKFDSFGNMFVSGMFRSSRSNLEGIFIGESTNLGLSFTYRIIASTPNSSISALDKPYLAVDEKNDFLYLLWTKCSPYGYSENECYNPVTEFSRSLNDGASWSKPEQLGQLTSEGVYAAISPSGALYVITQDLEFTKSLDYGSSFSNPIFIYGSHAQFLPFITDQLRNSAVRLDMPESIAVDQSSGAIFVTWQTIGFSNNEVDIAISKSIDAGQTWSYPTKVNNDPLGDGKDHFMPWVAVSSTSGVVGVSFYDRRADPNNTNAEYYVALSTNSGASFSDQYPLSTSIDTNSSFLGDYTALASASNYFLAAWTFTTSANQYPTTIIQLAKVQDPTLDTSSSHSTSRSIPIIHMSTSTLSESEQFTSTYSKSTGTTFTSALTTNSSSNSVGTPPKSDPSMLIEDSMIALVLIAIGLAIFIFAKH